MKKFSSLLISMLLLSASWAWAGRPVERDLRHCLDLQTNFEIAKCAGELTPWKGGKPAPRPGASEAGKMEAAKPEVAKPAAGQSEAGKMAAPAPDVAKQEAAKPEPTKKSKSRGQ